MPTTQSDTSQIQTVNEEKYKKTEYEIDEEKYRKTKYAINEEKYRRAEYTIVDTDSSTDYTTEYELFEHYWNELKRSVRAEVNNDPLIKSYYTKKQNLTKTILRDV